MWATTWNIYRNDSFRTNNHLEGWHNYLKRLVGKAHPNFYEFVEIIQKEQTATKVFMLQLEAGTRPPRRTLKVKAINRDIKLQELKECFDTNKRNMYKKCQHTPSKYCIIVVLCCCISAFTFKPLHL